MLLLKGLLGTLQNYIWKIIIILVVGIYHIDSFIFEVFLNIIKQDAIKKDVYQHLINNAYIILGIIMLFFIAFTLLKNMVNPDSEKNSRETIKKVITNLITSTILLALLPIIFQFAFDVQDSLIMNDVIGKLFSRNVEQTSSKSRDMDNEIKIASRRITNDIFTTFLHEPYISSPDGETIEDAKFSEEDEEEPKEGSSWMQIFGPGCHCSGYIGGKDDYKIEDVKTIFNKKEIDEEKWKERHDIYLLSEQVIQGQCPYSSYSKCSSHVRDDKLTFSWFIALIAGIFLGYIAVSYCLDMGLRFIKLIFYQVIAPIAVMARIIPNEKVNKIFGSWLKVTSTCYLEVFSRLFILYITIFLCNAIRENWRTSPSIGFKGDPIVFLLTKTCIILGLLTFMQRAPKLISEVTGIDSSNMKIGIKDKLKEATTPIVAATSAAGGLIAGHGSPLAAYRAGKAGWKNYNLKGIGAEAQRTENRRREREQGSTWRGRNRERLRRTLGLDSSAENIKRNVEEGRDIQGNIIQLQNDTGEDIQMYDSNGNPTNVINQIDPVYATRQQQEDFDTTQKYLQTQVSHTNEQMEASRRIQSSNNAVRETHDKIEDRARERVATSDIRWNVALSDGTTRAFNQSELEAYIANRQASGANADEINNLTRILNDFERDIWQEYVRASLDQEHHHYNDRLYFANGEYMILQETGESQTDDVNIRGFQDVLQQQINQNMVRNANGGVINNLQADTIEHIEDLSHAIRDANIVINRDMVNLEAQRTGNENQLNAITRLLTQLKEAQEAILTAPEYRSREADYRAINNQPPNDRKM